MSEQDFAAPSIIMPGHTITWAGEGLQDDRFLFGTDNGLVLECGIDGSLIDMHPLCLSNDEESINGISFYFDDNGLHLAASTRSDIILNSLIIDPKQRRRWHAGFGGHGVKRTLSNYFVAPAGPSGIVVLMLDANGKNRVQNPPAVEQFQYFYDFAALGIDSGKEVSVCAGRSDGLLFLHVLPGTGITPIKLSKVGDKNIDFVGVISIRNPVSPLAMVGLGKNRSLHFFRDPLRLREIDSVEFSYIPGTAYKVLRHGVHVIMLTSKGVCIIVNIIRQFHNGDNIGGERKVRFIKIEAVDINIAFDKWLLVVTTSGVVRMDLEELIPSVEIPDAIKRRLTSYVGTAWTTESENVQTETPVWTDTELTVELMQVVG
jgi:hypothetical protein